MKKIVFSVLALLALSSCLKEDYGECPPDVVDPTQSVTEVLSLRVRDKTTGGDITRTGAVDDATLVFFNAAHEYLGSMQIPADSLANDIVLPQCLADYDGDVWVSAWGNLACGNVDYLQNLSADVCAYTTPFVDMAMDPTYGTLHDCPGEVFFGTQQIKVGGLDSLQTRQTIVRRQQIDITQKNARMNVTVRGLPDPQAAADYYLVASNLRDGYTFDGTAVNDPDEQRAQVSVRRQKGEFASNGDLVSTEPIMLIHQNDPDAVTDATTVRLNLFQSAASGDIDLGGEILTDRFGEYIPLYSGQTTNVLITFPDDACTCPDNDVRVQIEVTDWDEIHQWTEY